MNIELWRKIYRNQGYSEEEIIAKLIEKEKQLSEEVGEEPEETEQETTPNNTTQRQEPKPDKKPYSKFYALRLSWELWDLIKDKPAKKIKKAIIKVYGKKKEQGYLGVINKVEENGNRI